MLIYVVYFYYRVYIDYIQQYTHLYLFITTIFYLLLIIYKLIFCDHETSIIMLSDSLTRFGNLWWLPGQSRRIFKGEKILSTPSFGGEVKSLVPCHRFAACKRSLNGVEVVISAKLPDNILAHSSHFRRWDLSRRGGHGGAWWWKVGTSKRRGKAMANYP